MGHRTLGTIGKTAVISAALLVTFAYQTSEGRMNHGAPPPTATLQPAITAAATLAEPRSIQIVTATPTPITAESHEIVAAKRTDITVMPPLVPTMEILPPIPSPTAARPTPTTDPRRPYPYTPYYAAVKAAMDTLVLEPLPPERTDAKEIVLRWRQAWSPPVLEGIPGADKFLPGAIPYHLFMHLRLHPYPSNPFLPSIDQRPTNGEYRIAENYLPIGTYVWSVQPEFVSFSLKYTGESMPWQKIEITSSTHPASPPIDSQHYKRAKAALGTVALQPLPVIRNAPKHEWLFRWEAPTWTPPNLEEIPGLTLMPDGKPYTVRMQFSIRSSPYNEGDYPHEQYVPPGTNEVRLYDRDLAERTYLWSVRAVYMSLDVNLVSDWLIPWQEVHIVK